MSDIAPTNDTASYTRPTPFALQSLNGCQQGQIFALDAAKSVLQFDAASTGAGVPPTRCLIIQGVDGIAIRTIQGELSVNNCVQQDAWLNENDELSCGAARLRLIRQSPRHTTPNGSHQSDAVCAPAPRDAIDESPQIFADDLAQDTRSEATDNSFFAESAGQTPSRFFGRFTGNEPADQAPLDGSTMCLSPDELRGLLEPTVYGADDDGYVDSTPVESALADELRCESADHSRDADTTITDSCHSETNSTTPLDVIDQSIDDYLLVPYASDTTPIEPVVPSASDTTPIEPINLPAVERTETPSDCDANFESDDPTAWFHVEFVEEHATETVWCWSDPIATWCSPESPTAGNFAQFSPLTDVHGVIVH